MMIPLDVVPVRAAVPDDAPQLMELCRRRHAECGIGRFAAERVESVFRRAFDPGRNDPAVIGVVGASAVEGSVGLVVEPAWDSETPILTCLWNYVLPEHRASPHIKELTAWALNLSRPDAMGLPVKIETITTRRTESLVRLYRRQLGEPVAVTWLCESISWRTH